MKTKLLTLAAAAAITAGIAGASVPASAAPIAPTTNAGISVQINLGGLFGVQYGTRRAYCHRLYWAARNGNFRARILYRRYCRGGSYVSYRVCRRWFHLGYRVGIARYRFLYRRYCRFYR